MDKSKRSYIFTNKDIACLFVHDTFSSFWYTFGIWNNHIVYFSTIIDWRYAFWIRNNLNNYNVHLSVHCPKNLINSYFFQWNPLKSLEKDTVVFHVSIEGTTFKFGMIAMSIFLLIVQRYSLIIFQSFQDAVCSIILNEIPWSHDICPLLVQKQTDYLLFAKHIDRIIKWVLLIFIMHLIWLNINLVLHDR